MCHFVEHDIGAADACDGFISAADPVASVSARPATTTNREIADLNLSISMTFLLCNVLSGFPNGSLDCIYLRWRDYVVYRGDYGILLSGLDAVQSVELRREAG